MELDAGEGNVRVIALQRPLTGRFELQSGKAAVVLNTVCLDRGGLRIESAKLGVKDGRTYALDISTFGGGQVAYVEVADFAKDYALASARFAVSSTLAPNGTNVQMNLSVTQRAIDHVQLFKLGSAARSLVAQQTAIAKDTAIAEQTRNAKQARFLAMKRLSYLVQATLPTEPNPKIVVKGKLRDDPYYKRKLDQYFTDVQKAVMPKADDKLKEVTANLAKANEALTKVQKENEMAAADAKKALDEASWIEATIWREVVVRGQRVRVPLLTPPEKSD